MQRALLVLLTLAGVLGEGEDAGSEEPPDEGDEAPFMLLLESDGGAGGGGAAALVSRRTAVTCAACARGATLRVRAGAAGIAQRVARVYEPLAGAGGLAVLELEREFPAEARTQPIVMATVEGDCGAPGALCHLVRALPKLLIVDAELARLPACRGLPMAELCLSGPVMCPSDRGTGVVCGGKLCGVLARSVGGEGGCGDTHAVYSLARRRKFVHCAHTLRNCGRGDCAEVCTERVLLDAPQPSLPSRRADLSGNEPHRAEPVGEVPRRQKPAGEEPHRTPPALGPAPSSSLVPATPQAPTVPLVSASTPPPATPPPSGTASTSSVVLQWVEAHNYVEYGGDERQYLPPSTPSLSPSSTGQPPLLLPSPAHSEHPAPRTKVETLTQTDVGDVVVNASSPSPIPLTRPSTPVIKKRKGIPFDQEHWYNEMLDMEAAGFRERGDEAAAAEVKRKQELAQATATQRKGGEEVAEEPEEFSRAARTLRPWFQVAVVSVLLYNTVQ